MQEARVYAEQLKANLGIPIVKQQEYDQEVRYVLKPDLKAKEMYVTRSDAFAMMKWYYGKLNNDMFWAVRNCEVIVEVEE